MPTTPQNVIDDNYYQIYRRGLINRHIASNGRFLQVTALVRVSENGILQLFDPIKRDSIERYNNYDQFRYTGYPLMVPEPFGVKSNGATEIDLGDGITRKYCLVAGGDNPLLYGGLAMATFSMEYICNLGNNSLEVAKNLYSFFLASEALDDQGRRTGLMLRRRSFWHIATVASTDELCGLLIGLLFFHRAAKKANDEALVTSIVELTKRIAQNLQDHDYNLPGKGFDAMYQWSFGRVFKDITGNPYRSDDTIPGVPDFIGSTLSDLGGALAGDIEDAVSLLLGPLKFLEEYRPVDLFDGVLKTLGTIYKVGSALNEVPLIEIDRKFFNVTMTTHALLMALISDPVNSEDKKKIAEIAGETFLKDFCSDNSYAADGRQNVLMGVVAKLCFERGPVRDWELSWRLRIAEMCAPLEKPSGYWCHDLPLASIKDSGLQPMMNSVGKWGEAFTWEHADPNHSFGTEPRLWNFRKAKIELGFNFKSWGDDKNALDLLTFYGNTIDQTQIHLEAAGLDYLFPRMLMAYLGYLPAPQFDETEPEYLPANGAAANELYLGNRNTKEVHRLDRLSPLCNFSRMVATNKTSYSKLSDAHGEGMDNCKHCLGDSHR